MRRQAWPLAIAVGGLMGLLVARRIIEAWRADYNSHRPQPSLRGLIPQRVRNPVHDGPQPEHFGYERGYFQGKVKRYPSLRIGHEIIGCGGRIWPRVDVAGSTLLTDQCPVSVEDGVPSAMKVGTGNP